MVDYILGITGIVLISTVLMNILPAGKTSVLIKNIIRLCAYLAVLSPVFNFFNNEHSSSTKIFKNYFSEEVIQTDDSYIQYCSEKIIENTEKSIEERLNKEYSIVANVRIWVDKSVNDSEIRIKKIEIDGKDISAEKQEKIRNDFKKEFSVDIEFTKGG